MNSLPLSEVHAQDRDGMIFAMSSTTANTQLWASLRTLRSSLDTPYVGISNESMRSVCAGVAR